MQPLVQVAALFYGLVPMAIVISELVFISSELGFQEYIELIRLTVYSLFDVLKLF